MGSQDGTTVFWVKRFSRELALFLRAFGRGEAKCVNLVFACSENLFRSGGNVGFDRDYGRGVPGA